MADTEKQIKDMGYELRVKDTVCNYAIYENKRIDQEIILEWDEDDQYCLLFSESLSRSDDWMTHPQSTPTALNIRELELFTARLKELQKEAI